MTKHRFFYYLILSFLALTVISCSNNEKEIRIGVSQCSGDAWHTLMNQELLNEAALYPNVKIEIHNAEDDNERQIEDIQILLDNKMDLLIVSPNEAEALTPIIERVYGDGIPVILVDSKINSDKYTTFIGSENEQVGRIAGQYIAWRLRTGGKIVVIEGLEGSTSTIDRRRGLDAVLSDNPQIKTVAKMNGNWRGDLTKYQFPKILQQNPDIDLVFAQNDYMAIAAKDVADSIMPGNQIAFVGVDALYGKGLGIESILNGKISASIIYETGGELTMQTAMSILNKDTTVSKEIILPTNIVSGYNNARLMQLQREHIDNMNSQISRLSDILTFNLHEVESQRILLYASVIIIFLILGVVVLLGKFFYDRGRANRILKLQKEKVESLSRQLEQATNAKLSFFTNVSHDFRTPLTLISDPIVQLEKSTKLDPKEKSMLTIAHKNVFVLLRLINQILDFRKYEDGKLTLHTSSFDFKEEINGWLDSFNSAAAQKKVQYDRVINEGNYIMVADHHKVERIIYNLLSNAFKFTPAGGTVGVETSVSDEKGRILHIVISDTGVGISKKDIDHIFDNFYQSEINVGGSGIGLAVVNSFVRLHEGKIRVESEVGKGSKFFVDIPMESLQLTEHNGEDLDTAYGDMLLAASREGALIDAIQTSLSAEGEPVEETDKPVVLIVEDNQDVRDYIKLQLSDAYSIIEAANGKEGIAMAVKFVPDIVVSDVMMPIMNGMEFCRRLKNELQTSHIPVLMLTAYGMNEQKIDAYNCGADGYLTKPFSTEVLLARISNLIENRKRLQDLFKSTSVGAIVSEENLKQIGNVDKTFIARLNDIIVKRMSESNLSVDDIGQDIGLSRVQLYRKAKSITGQSPNELLRIARLKKASELLANSDMNISEIAFAVGFSSSSYFAKCYKDYFGEAPTEFLKRNSNAGE